MYWIGLSLVLEEFCMKKSKILALVLIGLMMFVGLILAGCSNCPRGYDGCNGTSDNCGKDWCTTRHRGNRCDC